MHLPACSCAARCRRHRESPWSVPGSAPRTASGSPRRTVVRSLLPGGRYVHPHEFVKMVERTQTANLPDSYNTEPIDQELTTYYTDLVWGRVGVAVLGSGLDALYPREHSALASELVEGGGAVVSEYPPDATPFGWRFPPRNRIISGLCRAVVVVEAGVKGGALITARLALDQGVSVFAVPGDIDRDSSRGCNLLIRDGAHPVLDSDDLIDELELVVGPRRKAPPPDELAPDPLLDIVARTGEVSVDAVASQMQLPISEVLVRVVGLEASGRVTFDGLMLRANGH